MPRITENAAARRLPRSILFLANPSRRRARSPRAAGRRRYGFEIKRTDAPRVTPSMRHARADLKLDQLFVIHAGTREYVLTERVRAVPWSELVALTDRLD